MNYLTIRGVELARYTHPTPSERKDPEKRIIPGPIGLFRHGGGASEYKAVYVEVNPKEDVLITVTTSDTTSGYCHPQREARLALLCRALRLSSLVLILRYK